MAVVVLDPADTGAAIVDTTSSAATSQVAPALRSSLVLREAYETAHVFDGFYSGGRVVPSPDEQYLACARDDAITVVEAATGRIVHTLSVEGDQVYAFAFNPRPPSGDGMEIVSASASLLFRVWDVTTETVVREWKSLTGPTVDMAFDKTGTMIVVGSADALVRVWNVEQMTCTHNFRGHPGVVTRVLFHPQTSAWQVLSGGEDGAIRVWSLLESKCLVAYESHMSAVTALAFSDDLTRLYSAARDQVICVWSLDRNELVSTFPVYETVEAMVALPPHVADRPGSVWETPDAASNAAASGSKKGKKKNKKAGRNQAQAGATLLVTAGDRGRLRVWNAATSQCVFEQAVAAAAGTRAFTNLIPLVEAEILLGVTLNCNLVSFAMTTLRPKRFLVGFNDEITDVKFITGKRAPSRVRGVYGDRSGSDSGESSGYSSSSGGGGGGGGDQPGESSSVPLIAIATNSEHLRILDVKRHTYTILGGHTDIILGLAVSHDGAYVATAGKDGTARVWKTATGECVATCTGHTAAVAAVSWLTRDSRLLLTGSKDKTLKVWSTAGLAGGRGKAKKAAASADSDDSDGGDDGDGDLLALAVQATERAHDKDINAVAVAPNDRLAASCSQDRTVKLWSLPDLNPVGTLTGHRRGVWAVAFSAVDKVVATAAADKTLRLWSVETMACLKTFEGHTNSVLTVAFATSGTQLVSTGSDGLVKVWTIRTSECAATLDTHTDRVWGLDSARDGAMVVTGAADARLVVWRDVTAAKKEEEAREAEREIQREQELSNALRAKEYSTAIRIALELRHPRRLLKIARTIVSDPAEGGLGGLRAVLDGIVPGLEAEELATLLGFIRHWNAVAKTSAIAQTALEVVLRTVPPSRVAAVEGIEPLISALLPYSQRHYDRLDRLIQQSYLLDYTLASMQALIPAEAVVAASDGEARKRSRDAGPGGEPVGGSGRQQAASEVPGADAAPASKRRRADDADVNGDGSGSLSGGSSSGSITSKGSRRVKASSASDHTPEAEEAPKPPVRRSVRKRRPVARR